MSNNSFFWHDYETSGRSAANSRPMQFAGVRSDAELKLIGEPVSIYCQPAPDMVPEPEACLITGITPQLAEERGMPEYRFAAQVHRELAKPGTCGVGYNNLRFDDEFTRYLLYRNLYPPYGREWENGNSRWDILELARMAHALRPEGMEWPTTTDAEGKPMPDLKLESLCRANGIAPKKAHDALSDALSTLELARCLRKAQPKLFKYALKLRDKNYVRELIALGSKQPILHCSGKLRRAHYYTDLCLPLLIHPTNKNSIIAIKLSEDPQPLFDLDAEDLRKLMFTPPSERGAKASYPPLKEIKINKCPIVAAQKMLGETEALRLKIDPKLCAAHRQQVLDQEEQLTAKLRKVFEKERQLTADADAMLYSGFVSDADSAELKRLRQLPPEQLSQTKIRVQERRMREIILRYRGRNAPQSLNAKEHAYWQEHCFQRISTSSYGNPSLDAYLEKIGSLRATNKLNAEEITVLDALEAYADTLLANEYD